MIINDYGALGDESPVFCFCSLNVVEDFRILAHLRPKYATISPTTDESHVLRLFSSMKIYAALALGLLFYYSTATVAASGLVAQLALVDSGLSTTAPDFVSPGPTIDVYEVVVTNNEAADVTSLAFTLPGPWINNAPSVVSFHDSPGPYTQGPFTFAETFFVLPPGVNQLALGTIDSNTLLESSYSGVGSVALVPAGSSATVAVLSVATGTAVDLSGYTGWGVVSGLDVPITLLVIPEPSAAFLSIVALFGVGLRRR